MDNISLSHDRFPFLHSPRLALPFFLFFNKIFFFFSILFYPYSSSPRFTSFVSRKRERKNFAKIVVIYKIAFSLFSRLFLNLVFEVLFGGGEVNEGENSMGMKTKQRRNSDENIRRRGDLGLGKVDDLFVFWHVGWVGGFLEGVKKEGGGGVGGKFRG